MMEPFQPRPADDPKTAARFWVTLILQIAAAGAATGGWTAIVDLAGAPRILVSLGAIAFVWAFVAIADRRRRFRTHMPPSRQNVCFKHQ